MRNIEEARLGAVNHYQVADTVLAYAKADVNKAGREGEVLIAGCRCGTVAVRRAEARGFYTIHRQLTPAEVVANIRDNKMAPACPAPIFFGTKADTVLYLAGLYTIQGGAQ
jgi:hypothetical protein